MSIAQFGTKSRGMVYGAFRTIGAGIIIKDAHICPRCNNFRMSKVHKARCKYKQV